jgi:hypothetical protein
VHEARGELALTIGVAGFANLDLRLLGGPGEVWQQLAGRCREFTGQTLAIAVHDDAQVVRSPRAPKNLSRHIQHREFEESPAEAHARRQLVAGKIGYADLYVEVVGTQRDIFNAQLGGSLARLLARFACSEDCEGR